MEKSAGINLELKDLDTSKRTAIIKHAVYTSIDRVGDISHKGMFTKSWNERKPKIHINHDAKQIPGTTVRTFDDNEAAYTEMKFGNWTLGNDALEMASEGIFTGASFGYLTQKKDYTEIKGRRIRNLREVLHEETSLLTVPAAHPEAGIIILNKADELDYEDASALLQWNDEQVQNMKVYVKQMEGYCRKAKASDDTILALQKHLTEYKQIITDYDTALTQLATEPGASDESNEITNFLNSLNIEIWKKQSLSNSQR
jgi:HK97 family phage prohead protease